MASERAEQGGAVTIAVRDLSKVFGGRVRALDGVSTRIRAGEIYGLVGGNGAGKTTFMRTLLGLVKPSGGTIEVTLPAAGATQGEAVIGSLIEAPSFVRGLSGRDNLRLLARYWGLVDSDVDAELAIVGLSDAASRRKYRTYSLGMKQRLGVAAALLGRPNIIVLDEPTNGLDPAGIADLRELFVTLKDRGHTVILSSHLLSEVEGICDRIGVLKNGRLVAEGTLAEIRGMSRRGARVTITVDQVDKALAVLSAAGIAAGASATVNLAIEIPLDDVSTPTINTLLVSAGINVAAVTTAENSLEEMYFEITQDVAERAEPVHEGAEK
jgi:ABC-2 type transport system ATP-binding protein